VNARARYAALALATAALGLAVHRGGRPLGGAARDVLGDALWAAMLAWWVAALAPRLALGRRTALAFAACAAVEASQAYRAPALDRVRRTAAGRLVLGSDFDPRDLAAYAAGVVAAAAADRALRRRA
jgi:hypothetical protein